MKSILVTGGAGYIGSVLCPKLLQKGYRVTVLDCLLFDREPIQACLDNENFTLIQEDIRNSDAIRSLFAENSWDAVIHLAAISNDPTSELNPDLTKKVNLDAVRLIMEESKKSGAKRFLYASSASVYGIKTTEDVTEALSLEPITLYAKYKAEGEDILNALVDDTFCGVSVRAATVCGLSPRLRLDLTINILSYHGIFNNKIRVFGGSQMRPNVHIQDLVEFYMMLLEAPAEKVNGKAFNVSNENASVMELAQMIQGQLDGDVPIEIVPTEDIRSYHLSAQKAKQELGFACERPLTLAVDELKQAVASGGLQNPELSKYHNIRQMKENHSFMEWD